MTLNEADSEDADATPRDLVIDPFSFMPGVASCVTGLGGAAPGHDPAYVFHTPYVHVARGPATFTVRFRNLVARRGGIVVRVNMLPLEPGAHARLVNSERIAFNRLIGQHGEIRISFEGYRGMTYAVLGMLTGDSDATADGLEVTLDRPHDSREDYRHAVAEARSTIFGVDAAKPTARLISTATATLADPVSQMCTAAQMDEPVYASWVERMRQQPHRHRKQWEFVYILQVLDRYGMLRPGSRGIGFGCGVEPLPAIMAAMGAEVVATDLPVEHEGSAAWHASGQHGSAIASLRRPDICDDAVFERNVSFRPADMTAIPPDLVNFDYTWSSCAYEHLGSIEAGLKFVEDSIACLRPGGLAVHTSEFNLTSNDDTLETGATVLFRRRDMERLALRLISRGHEVAQIKLDSGREPLDEHIDIPPYANDPHLKMALSRYVITSFGIIARKAISPL